jgi:hypothetical protein
MIDTPMAEQPLGTTCEMSAAAERAEFEAATAADPGNPKLWAVFELKDGGGGIEAARAIFERKLTAIPSPQIEECVYWSWNVEEGKFGDVASGRRVFERWVRRLPRGGGMFGKEGWRQYLEFEVHNGGVERVRAVGEALLAAHPMDPYAYVYYIRALAALSRHKEAFALAERGVKEISGCCRGHDERLRRFMARYIQRLETKQSTAWDVINF